MNEYKIKLSKLNNKGLSYESVSLSIIEEEQLSCLLSKFFEADFKDRERLIKLLENG